MNLKVKRTNLVVWTAFFYAFVCWSVPFYVVGLTGSIVMALTLPLLPLIGIKSKINIQWMVILAFIAWLPLLVKWGFWSLYISPIYLLASLYIVSKIDRASLARITRLGTNLVVVLLAGAYVATLYYWLGLPRVLDVEFGGRPLLLYLSSFSFEYPGYIRPSGIYDEPGALSFVVCIVAYLRTRLNFNQRNTVILLFFGLITTSLALLVFLIVFIILEVKLSSKKNMTWVLVASISAFLVSAGVRDTSAFYFISNRISVTDEGKIAGDNRTVLMESAFDVLKNNEVFVVFGMGPTTAEDIKSLSAIYGDFETNPLSPIVRAGLLGSIWYYIFLVYYLVNSMSSRRRLLMITIFLLLLQRPYVMNYGYSMMLLLVVAADFYSVGLLGLKKVSAAVSGSCKPVVGGKCLRSEGVNETA